jgi:MtN3 and saliva related transmembrane protein
LAELGAPATDSGRYSEGREVYPKGLRPPAPPRVRRLPDAAMFTEAIGWFATAVLLATVGRQVYSQWRSGSTQGVSSWLFIGQMTASTAFLTYSLLLGNWVFVVANAMLLFTAALGQWIYKRNVAREPQQDGGKASVDASPSQARGKLPPDSA